MDLVLDNVLAYELMHQMLYCEYNERQIYKFWYGPCNYVKLMETCINKIKEDVKVSDIDIQNHDLYIQINKMKICCDGEYDCKCNRRRYKVYLMVNFKISNDIYISRKLLTITEYSDQYFNYEISNDYYLYSNSKKSTINKFGVTEYIANIERPIIKK